MSRVATEEAEEALAGGTWRAAGDEGARRAGREGSGLGPRVCVRERGVWAMAVGVRSGPPLVARHTPL